MKKLWQKQYTLNTLAEQYCSGTNVQLDNYLAQYDVWGTMAQGAMLAKIGILTQKEYQEIQRTLSEILKLIDAGAFTVTFGDEDIHTKVEGYLTDTCGDAGKKIHTARSRNDQINLDVKLYTKDELINVAEGSDTLIKSFYRFAKAYETVLMPGYTHMQKAMPSSIGMWAGSFAESLLDDLRLLKSAYLHNDQSPLGSGAAYGVSLAIDRTYTAKLLGFANVQNNSLYAQVVRGKSEAVALHALAQIMLTLSRFAGDMLLFTTAEFDFFTVPPELCTGSSIMPQKNNLDIMEVLRARTHLVIQYEQSTQTILAGLPSGYNADFGETKQALIASFEIVTQSLDMTRVLVEGMKPNIEVLTAALTPEVFATHAAYELVKKKVPFRDAYHLIGASLEKIPSFDHQEVLEASSHMGGLGNLGLENITRQLTKDMQWWKQQKKQFHGAIADLVLVPSGRLPLRSAPARQDHTGAIPQSGI